MSIYKTKSKIKKYFLSFTNKLMLLYLILVLLSDVIIGVYSYTALTNSRTSYIKEDLTKVLQQTRDNVDTQIGDVQRISNQLFDDYSLQNILSSKSDAYGLYDLTRLYLIPVLKSNANLSLNPISINIYTQNNNMSESYTPTDRPLSNDRSYNIYNSSRIYSKSWYLNIIKENEDNVWRQVENDAKNHNISLLRKFISYDNFEQIGYLRIVVSMKDLFKSINSYKVEENSKLYLIENKGNTIVYSSNGDSIVEKIKDKADDDFVIKKDLYGGKWSLVALVSQSELHAEASKIRNVTILICSLTFIIVSILGIFISKRFDKKVKNIVISIRSFKEGELTKRIKYTGEDEFGYISSTFNKMADNIQELIEEGYITEINKKAIELEALQSQINPHFLYNTLSSINSLANLGEINKVSEMVSSLVKFYRLTLNKGKAVMAVGEELEQVKAYIDIQEIKYGNRFKISYDIDEKVLKCTTLKLILQPFVENALNHAWYEENIHIRIVAEMTNESIIFKVIDNGIGMKKETISLIFNPKGESLGYGIRNVNDRIRLHYGKQYGVSIFSRIGIGTTIKIIIPK
ncbi:sensor histidine kinase [Clostridium lacusfryxellense]|uniref:sensor histidine kinase n=1 Tax=Clostridium lacusfryxellense TaxID=205328 RepID=UPI001C0D95BE|nr:sensor histidine kinase [Clostridium lacusfryxellense]MBU3112066.1 histidine kinase [Clostridium lacusfryxellense]